MAFPGFGIAMSNFDRQFFMINISFNRCSESKANDIGISRGFDHLCS